MLQLPFDDDLWGQDHYSTVSLQVYNYIFAIVDVLLQFPQVGESAGASSTKDFEDEYIARLLDILDSLYIELASLMRHFNHHQQLEAASSTSRFILITPRGY